jgi:hypothetical protein
VRAGERLWWTAFWWLLASLVAFLVTSDFVDAQGRKDWMHTGPVPRGVVQLTPDTYLIHSGTGLRTSDVCRGKPPGNADHEVIVDAHPTADGIYVQCGRDQLWNDRRPKSVNYLHAMERVGTSPAWWALDGGALGLLLLFGVVPRAVADATEHRREARRRRRRRREAAARAELDREAQRRELVAAYARDEITQEEFERGLERVLSE